eukprot:TRINITY_DN9231_c0_g1_i1.p1 TRINITY_DN9231_c0_g1~~TRINITY_DN9231_c0_g1_i1.p1  ORF type:complete len:870 (+),score=268.88 TRINITY_DN9231_c0_g1_i1:113-2722(+)
MAAEEADDEDDYDPFSEQPAAHVRKPKEKAPPPRAGLEPKASAARKGLEAKASLGGQTAKAASMLPTGFLSASLEPSAPPGPPPPPKAVGGQAQASSKAAGAFHALPKSAVAKDPASPASSKAAGAFSATAKSASAVTSEKLARVSSSKAAGFSSAVTKSSQPMKTSLMLDLPPAPPPGPAPMTTDLPPGPPPALLAGGAPLPDSALPPLLPAFLPPLPMNVPLGLQGILPPLPPLPPLPTMMLGAVPGVPLAGPALSAEEPKHWETHLSPDGAAFYFCKKTNESRWQRPMSLKDTIAPPAPPAAETLKRKLGEVESWETIGKTGWLRVETENGFKYFYHKKSKKTAWECPREIAKEVAELDGVLGFQAPDEAEGAQDAGKSAEGGAGLTNGPPGAPEAGGEVAGESAAEAEEVPLTKAEKKAKAEAKKEAEKNAAEAKNRLMNFKNMMMEKGVKAFDKYETWLPKLIHDSRFTVVPSKDRKTVFETLAKRIDAEKKKKATAEKKTGRDGFRQLLAEAEKAELLTDQPVAQVLRKLERKFDEDSRWKGLLAKERERLITEAIQELSKKKKDETEKSQYAYRQLVQETLRGHEQDPLPWRDARRKMEKDPRWAPVSSVEREKLYEQAAKDAKAASRQKQRRSRQEQEEVESLRKKRRLGESEDDLRNLLAEKVKAPYCLDWDDVKTALRDRLKDNGLSEGEQERIFEEYKQKMIEARREQFLTLLTNTPAELIGPEMDFELVLARSCVDPSVAKLFSVLPEVVLQSAWQEWRDQAQQLAIESCKQWLRSCEHFRGKEAVTEGGAEFEHLYQLLSQDIRFRRLAHSEEQQRRLISERLQELRDRRAKGKAGMAAEEEDEDHEAAAAVAHQD